MKRKGLIFKKNNTLVCYSTWILSYLLCLPFTSNAQFNSTISSTLNFKCNGIPCDYNGPSILINELMISPQSGDGSISGPGPNGGMGEWIELYNPDLCESVDISCYYLGNFTYEGAGGFRLPQGVVVPPCGFALIRGSTAPQVPANRLIQNGGNVVEVIVPGSINGPGVCCTGTRVWFPNAGGWFAFYDANGVPQDAVRWGPGNNNDINSGPCIPSRAGCTNVPSLASYAAIPGNRKTQVNTQDANSHIGLSIRRIPDGGAWANIGQPTYANCNAACIPPGVSTCDGTATVNVNGGTPPFSFQWNDPVLQTTQTAIELCAGTYTVTVTDATGISTQTSVTISNFVPDVTLDISATYCLNDPAVVLSNFSPTAGQGASSSLTGPGMTGFTFTPLNAGVGTHTITYNYADEYDCANSATDQITVLDLPQLSVDNNLGTYCVTENTTHFIYTPAGGTLTGSAVVNNQFSPLNAGVGSYNLIYSYTDNNGCTNTLPIVVEVVGLPNLTINSPATICVNDPAFVLTANPPGGDFLVNGGPAVDFNPAGLGVGTHTIFYDLFDQFGCYNFTETTTEVIALPTIGFSPEYAESCPPLTTTFVAETSPVVSCIWDFGDGTITTDCGVVNHTYTQSDCYDVSITVISAEGCVHSAVAPNIVCVHPVPAANFAFSPNPVSEFYTDVQFHNLTANGTIFNWTIDGGFPSSSTETHPATVYPPETPGEYPVMLIAENEFGCIDTAYAVVIVFPDVLIYVPNTFTPDGNQYNNMWKPSIIGLSDDGYELLVFNRWGELVWETQNLQEAWDGTYKNVRVKEGTYVWKLEGVQRHTKEILKWTGHVNVLY